MPTDDDLPPLQSEAAFGNNPRTAFNFFVSKGLTQVQAAGVVGNLMQESSVNPAAVELGGGPGRGIAQWSVGGRFNVGSKSLTSFAAARGLSKWALNTQLDFIWYELATVGGYGLADLRAATTLNQAVYAFQAKYEICGKCAAGKRLTYAQEVLAQYGGSTSTGTGTGTGTTPPPPPTMETCYSGTLDREMPENACVESMYDGLWYQCSSGQWVDRWSDPDACNGEYPL
ncbi:MAG TPA: phage tail tip lysozyme [Kofleriaceae bacterium]|nr:phage tail tip lysozyme [Kofleriaceae bacterium]